MAFCEECGTEVGFFSRKRAQRADGRVVVVCKPCAERRVHARAPQSAADAPASTVAVHAAASEPFDSVFEVLAPGTTPTASPLRSLEAEPEQLFRFLVHQFYRETNVDISADTTAVERLRVAAIRAADELRSSGIAEVNLPFLTADPSGPKHLWIKVRAR